MLLAMLMIATMAPAVAEESTTLTVACWDLTTTPYYEAIKTGFEAANPGITIEYVDLASQDYNIKCSTMLALSLIHI